MHLKKGELGEFRIATSIFLGTDIFSTQKKDYRNELMYMLPTIYLSYYIFSEATALESCYIQKVKLNE